MQHTFEQWCWQTFSSREPTQCRKAMRRGAVLQRHAPLVEHPLDVDGRIDVVVDAVTVLLLDAGVEKGEARSDHHGVGFQPFARRKHHAVARHFRDLAPRAHLDVAGGEPTAQFVQHLVRRRERRKEFVPAREFSAQVGVALQQERRDASGGEFQCRLHAGDSPADDDYAFSHHCLIL